LKVRDLVSNKNLFDIKPYQPGLPIEEVRRSLGIRDVIKMASNENALGPSKKALRAIRAEAEGVNRYPDGGVFYLRRKLARRLGVREDSLIFGNGSDEIITFATRTFLGKGDEVLISDPTFLIYKIASSISSAVVKSVPRLQGFRYDIKRLKKAISERTKMIFLANPDNPTGSYISRPELEDLLRAIPKGVILFLDEAYFELVSRKDYANGLDYFMKKNIIVARTFSKAYGLAGLRVGYGVANPAIIDMMNKVREPFNVNILAEKAAVAALDDKEHIRRTRALLRDEKAYLYKELKKSGIGYVESQTNFILVDVKDDSTKVFRRLLKKGVIVRDMKSWKIDNYIRVTIGLPRENGRFMRELKEILNGGER